MLEHEPVGSLGSCQQGLNHDSLVASLLKSLSWSLCRGNKEPQLSTCAVFEPGLRLSAELPREAQAP